MDCPIQSVGVLCALLLPLMAVVSADTTPTARLADVFAPMVVATPPTDAFAGLVRCPGGETRHYGGAGFIFSRDEGLTWQWRKLGERHVDGRPAGGGWAMSMSPTTGTWMRVEGRKDGTYVRRSTDGPDGEYSTQRVGPRHIMIRPALFLKHRERVLFAGYAGRPARIRVWRSDDDGVTWSSVQLPPGPAFEVRPPHAGPRWENWCVEPTILELRDGRLWMVARTARDRHRQCVSNDGGATWSAWEPSRFYGTLTMPTLHRLADERILMLWCNTTPLPEVDRSAESIPESTKNGRWEDVFTNRDACHAAISDDDGHTWRGFRELRLNPLRNRGDIGQMARHDFSVHQMQALNVAEGKVLVAHGQDGKVRRVLLFDPDWLLEPRREDRFENGLDNWSIHKHLRGTVGHCAYNRVPGARLVKDAGQPVLHLRHVPDERLVFSVDGAVWNFPATPSGSATVRLQLRPGSRGARICLVDRWLNATDPVVRDYAMYAMHIDESRLTPGVWHTLAFAWQAGEACEVSADGNPLAALPLLRPTLDGISYFHLQAAEAPDPHGFLVAAVAGGR